MKLNRILVPIDFSEASHAALGYARELAAQTGASLVALHVVEPLLYPSEYGLMLEAPRELELTAADGARKALSDLIEVESRGGRRAETKVVIGRPGDAICDEAKAAGADLIVLGTHGRTGLKRLVLGSVADQVVRLAPCPVLTVKSEKGR